MYCEVDEVLAELHPTLKLEMQNHYGEGFSEFITGHLNKAEGFVNASLARKYRVPLNSPSSEVKTAEAKIAAYFASAAFSENEELLQDKYDTAREMLNNLVKADTSFLVDESYADTVEMSTGKVIYGADKRIFTRGKLALWN